MKRIWLAVAVLFLAGCTVHPAGESDERRAADAAGAAYEKLFEDRIAVKLSDAPTADDLVRYAWITNADVEASYWQWRAAIEQIPIDGTQASNLTISLGTTLDHGAFDLDRTVATAANDPMADLMLPNKLSVAARRALENARAAGRRFRKAQFELRAKLMGAYDDFALNAELIRLAESNVRLFQTTVEVTAARSQSGMAGQVDVLKAQNDLELARNDLENMRSQLPVERAAINALLNRDASAALAAPNALPATRPVEASDADLLAQAARNNPELTALADEIRARREDIELAKLQYEPDFDLAASTDLKGITQELLGTITLPMVRGEALEAGVRQAEANLKAAEAMRRQAGSDLSARLVDDIATLRDADRQLSLLRQTVLPRARQIVDLSRSAYQTGNFSFLDLLDSQRSLIDLQRLAANLDVIRDKRLVDIETIEAGG
jgi:cobalt-zinc-cadmium efflux system outer membrane protein